MKRTKRKYTRKATTTPVESKSTPIEVVSSPIPQDTITVSLLNAETGELTTGTVQVGDHEFTYTDLPLSLRIQIESAIKYRKRLGLFDDSVERKSQAIRMFRGDRAR